MNATESFGWKAADKHQGKGFALVELLVVLALLIVLVVLFSSSGSRQFQTKQKKVCAGNLHSLHTALQLFANEHDGMYPAKPSPTSEGPLALLVPKFTSRGGPFRCPGTKAAPLVEGRSLDEQRIDYAYYMGVKSQVASAALMSDAQRDTLAKAANQAVFSADGRGPGNNHNKFGGNILLGDGRVETTPDATTPVALPLPAGVVLLNPKP